MDYKDRISKKIDNYIIKNEIGTSREPKRINKSPEKDVEAAVLQWSRANGFDLHVVDSSQYDNRLGRMGSAKASVGFPDLCGNYSTGLSVYIELKAKDRRSKLSEAQRVFLTKKANQNCFAVVVDSVMRLEQYWKGFKRLKSPEERSAYLVDCLPKKKKPKPGTGHDELGF